MPAGMKNTLRAVIRWPVARRTQKSITDLPAYPPDGIAVVAETIYLSTEKALLIVSRTPNAK